MTAVLTAYGRFATSLRRAPGIESIAAATASRTSGASAAPGPMASEWMSRTFGRPASRSAASACSLRSTSTATTAPAASARQPVSPPVPAPTSSATSRRSSVASSTTRRITAASTRKFCPRTRLGRIPRARNCCLEIGGGRDGKAFHLISPPSTPKAPRTADKDSKVFTSVVLGRLGAWVVIVLRHFRREQDRRDHAAGIGRSLAARCRTPCRDRAKSG